MARDANGAGGGNTEWWENLQEFGNLADFAGWNYGEAGPQMDIFSWGQFAGAVPPPPTGTGTEPPPGEEEQKKRTGKKKKPHWDEEYHVAGAPDWWKGMTATGGGKGAAQGTYAMMLNAMIPYLSAEDQATAAHTLAQMYGNVFKEYANVSAKPKSEVSTGERQWLGSAERAQGMMDTMNKLKEAMGGKLGNNEGFQYMTQLIKAFGQNAGQGNGDWQTREGNQAFAGVAGAQAQAAQNTALALYSNLTKMLVQPTYSNGWAYPTTKLENGQIIYGQAMPGYF